MLMRWSNTVMNQQIKIILIDLNSNRDTEMELELPLIDKLRLTIGKGVLLFAP